jgi:hypothetical protein
MGKGREDAEGSLGVQLGTGAAVHLVLIDTMPAIPGGGVGSTAMNKVGWILAQPERGTLLGQAASPADSGRSRWAP